MTLTKKTIAKIVDRILDPEGISLWGKNLPERLAITSYIRDYVINVIKEELKKEMFKE